ncbi:MAG: histidine ammonia-lyase [Planctomycetota bacterium]
MPTIDGSSIKLDDIPRLTAAGRKDLRLDDSARKAVEAARATVEDILASGRVVYGINTGFGKLASTRIPADKLATLQRNLILSHAVGVGEPLSKEIARLALILRANNLACGHSGVRTVVVERLLDLVNADVVPVIPSQGSVGASGDLAPLAHMTLVLLGEGEAWVGDERLPGAEALAAVGLEPLELEAKEGLALINGTQISCAIGAVALSRALELAEAAEVACAMTLEALKGSVRPFDSRVGDLRPHPGHARVSANIRALMAESEILASHADCGRVQDQYSLRCVPQVHGAVRDALDHVRTVVEREMNSVTDNPLIFPADGDVISAGNFHAEPLAIPFDYAAAAVCELANISERRLENMVNPDLSGLPPFLIESSGLNSGFMIAQVTAAALVSENKCLAHPASVDSVPTSANKEDHVSMAPIAARKFGMIVENTAHVLAIELAGALQGLRLGNPERLRPGRGVAAAFDFLAALVPPLTEDRILQHDFAAVRRSLDDGRLLETVRRSLA